MCVKIQIFLQRQVESLSAPKAAVRYILLTHTQVKKFSQNFITPEFRRLQMLYRRGVQFLEER